MRLLKKLVIEWRPISKRTLILYGIFAAMLCLLSWTQASLKKLYHHMDQKDLLEQLMHAPPPKLLSGQPQPDTFSSSTTEKNSTATTAHTSNNPLSNRNNNLGRTKIIGFADYGYMKIAHRWYIELEKLGYTEHMIAAQDSIAGDYFASHNMRYDLIHSRNKSLSPGLKEECKADYQSLPNDAKRNQRYRRTLFGSRWHYVLKQLEQNYNVLLTDVDNVYAQYKPMSELESSEYDIFHAYAGTVPSFPLNLFRLMGLTLCGGMSWLRATNSVIDFVKEIVSDCGCITVDNCDCFCDDQVVVNKYVYYHYIWDQRKYNHNITVPETEEEMQWEGYSGYSNKTGLRFKIWDRDVAYRAKFDENKCPNKTRNWIAMPTGLDRLKTWDTWKEKCLGINERT